MKKQELLEEVVEGLFDTLQKQCDEFYKLNGKLEKIKGRIAGRKILSEFANDAEIEHEIDTSIWDDEKSGIDNYNNELSYLRQEIKKGIEKIKIIKSLSVGKKSKK